VSGKNDFLKNNEKFGDPSGLMLGGRVVDISSINENDVLVLKNGVWVGIPATSGGATPETVIQYPITVNGTTIGKYKSGDIIPAGTSFEDIIKTMMTSITPATYTSPTCSIHASENKILEAGSIINPNISPSFIQNDAGVVNRYVLKKNNTVVKDTAVLENFIDNNLLVGDNTINFKATMYFDSGPIKKDNLGNASPTGKIKSGFIDSNIISYTGVRNLFYGCSTSDIYNPSNEEIRSLLSKESVIQGTSVSLNIPAGTKKITIAYPSYIRDINSIKYIEGLNAEIKSIFQKSLLDISGANNYNPIEYKIYTYIPSIPFSSNATYNIII
jgi:hypothetical protein